MPLDPTFWTETLRNVVADILVWLPVLAGAILWLLLGWIIARVAQTIIGGLLRRIGFDRVAQRAGIADALARGGFDASASRLFARIVYWLIFLLFLLAALESLGLQGVVQTLEQFVAYLPQVLAAALILLFGSLLARIVGEAVRAFAGGAGVTAAALLGQAVQYILLVFVIILALGQLGIETTLLTTVTTVLVTATALALALAFGLGSRDLARHIMAGFHVRDIFATGQELVVGKHQGRVVEIGAVKTVIQTEKGLLTIPNAVLAEEEVTVVEEPAAAGPVTPDVEG